MARYRFWWRDGSRTKYTHGSGGEDHPADWVGSRAEAEERRMQAMLFGVLKEDTEWGVETRDFPRHELKGDGEVVLLTEEHFYRKWLWETGMSPEALTKWWGDMESVEPHFMDPSATLPGEMVQVWQCGADSVFIELPDKSTRYLQIPENVWTGHIHLDDDSGIQNPSGEAVLHKGFCSPPGTGSFSEE